MEQWVNEALTKVSTARKLAAIGGIVSHLEGKPVQRHEIQDVTPECLLGKNIKGLEYFAITGEWPE